jgi:hypothetical protein
MDRTNTWFRRTVLGLALLWSFPAGAGSPEVERIAKVAAFHADVRKVMVVGVTHHSERLAEELLELLTLLRAKDNFDCFFVEDPTDLQDEFDQAVNEENADRLVEAYYHSKKPIFLWSFSQLGRGSEAEQAYLGNLIDESMKEASKTFPVNQSLLIYLKENKISLLPYDADSRSKLMSDTVVFDIHMHWRFVNNAIPEPDDDMQVAMIKNIDDRNSIMAENIVAKFASYGCHRAVVTVGAAHVADKGQIERSRGVRLDAYTPLQARLREKGLPSTLVGELLGQ